MGRRGGKSNVAALLAVYEAVFNDHKSKLAPGEIATVMVIAADRRQARTVMRYIRGLFEWSPMLARMILRDTEESIFLSNRCAIEIQTATHRGTRGYTVACAILDEVAFWLSEGANPDVEIINAIRPSLSTLGGKLVALSSPYSRRGVLWNAYNRYYGQPGNVLVAQAPSLLMNPTLPPEVVTEAYAEDSVAASAEYGAEFRADLEAFVTRETIEALTRPSPLELPFDRKHRYFAFTDPAGGGQDDFTLCISHREGDTVSVDMVRGLTGTPSAIVAEYSTLLSSYSISTVQGDRYGGSWPADEFRKHGVRYVTAEKPKSELYKDSLPLLNSGRVELPPLARLHNQFISLERRTSRGGRDSIDHPPGAHDDLANALAGAAVYTTKPVMAMSINIGMAY